MSKTLLVAQTVAELAHKLGDGDESVVQLMPKDIAEFVGFSRQAVNQALKQLEAEGLVRTKYDCVEVDDLAELQEYARAGSSDCSHLSINALLITQANGSRTLNWA